MSPHRQTSALQETPVTFPVTNLPLLGSVVSEWDRAQTHSCKTREWLWFNILSVHGCEIYLSLCKSLLWSPTVLSPHFHNFLLHWGIAFVILHPFISNYGTNAIISWLWIDVLKDCDNPNHSQVFVHASNPQSRFIVYFRDKTNSHLSWSRKNICGPKDPFGPLLLLDHSVTI